MAVETQSDVAAPTLPARSRGRSHLAGLAVVVLCAVAGNLMVLGGFRNDDALAWVGQLTTATSGQTLPGVQHADPNIGYSSQALGHRAALDLLDGRGVWWNPYEGLGTPLLGEQQSAALFPPNLLNALEGGQVWFRLLLEATAGVATYLLLLRMRLGVTGATTGGVLFALNGTFAWLFNAPGNPVAFLPLTLLGIELAAAAATAGRWWRSAPVPVGVIAVAVGLSLYAGFPEVALVDGLLCAVWAGWRLAEAGERRSALAVTLAVGVGAGLVLAAPDVVAFADFLPHAFIGGHSGSFAGLSQPASGLASLAMPYVYGPIAADTHGQLGDVWGGAGGYLTAATAVLAGLALPARRLRSLRLLLAGWVALLIARTYGFSPVVHATAVLPGLGNVATYRYDLPAMSMAAAVLAALAVDDVARGEVRRRRAAIGAAVGLAAVGGAAALAAHTDATVHAPAHLESWVVIGAGVAAGVVMTVAAAAALARNHPRAAAGVIAALACAEAIGWFCVPQLSDPTSATVDLAPVTFLRGHLGTSRFYSVGALAPNYGAYFGLASVAENDLPVPEAYAAYVDGVLDPGGVGAPIIFDGSFPSVTAGDADVAAHLAAFEAIGVRYLVTTTGNQIPDSTRLGITEAWADQSFKVLELPHPAPTASAPGCGVRAASWWRVTTRCPHPSTLTRIEVTMPGWSATVNGAATAVRSADGGLHQLVQVPAGVADVRFAFRPPGIVPAVGASAATALALVAWAAATRMPTLRRRRHQPRHRAR